jgi:energy-coupling factor transport system permease protein
MATAGHLVLKTLNPLSKLLVCIVWLAAAVLIFDLRFQLASILTVSAALIFLNRTSPLLLLALMIPFSLFGFGFLTTSLLFHRESEYALRMAEESVVASPAFSAGMVLFLRAIACGTISAFFALTTDPGDAVRALIAYGKLPPRLGYSLFAAMQLVPDLAAEVHQMRMARAMKSGRRIRRIPGPIEVMTLVIPLLAFAIRRAGRTAIAMEARGLSPDAPRTIMYVPPFRRSDIVFVLIALGVIASCSLLAR